MKTVGPEASAFEEAQMKGQEAISMMMEVLDRLAGHEQIALQGNLVTAAQAINEAHSIDELRMAICGAVYRCVDDLRVCGELSPVASALARWLGRAEERIARCERMPGCNWQTFLHKWPRLWKASLLSLVGRLDMAVWVGDAIEAALAHGRQRLTTDEYQQKRVSLVGSWKRVEEVMKAGSVTKLKTVLRRVRRDRELRFLQTACSTNEGTFQTLFADAGAEERALGLEEFILKGMIELAATNIAGSGRVATGIREFADLEQLIEEHIVIVGTTAAEASAMTLVLETVRAEEKYLALRRTWGTHRAMARSGIPVHAKRLQDIHEAHCAVIDAYMELSDCKSQRGVMLCYELPIFTQLLYDQRKLLDLEIREIGIHQQTRTVASAGSCGS